ncbi:MAG: hypothetical protein OXC11_10415 [Rhodospirillales bacterium]|nr:hypothetical protein [Rhodospirillales bacterium]
MNELPIHTVEVAESGEMERELRAVLRTRNKGCLWITLHRLEKACVRDELLVAGCRAVRVYRGAWVAVAAAEELKRRRRSDDGE